MENTNGKWKLFCVTKCISRFLLYCYTHPYISGLIANTAQWIWLLIGINLKRGKQRRRRRAAAKETGKTRCSINERVKVCVYDKHHSIYCLGIFWLFWIFLYQHLDSHVDYDTGRKASKRTLFHLSYYFYLVNIIDNIKCIYLPFPSSKDGQRSSRREIKNKSQNKNKCLEFIATIVDGSSI